jgi:hypothetical protein
MAEWARRIEGEIKPSDRPDETIYLHRKPFGVVGGILPWNFPFFLFARKMAPALITGNTIVIKPSEETPLNAYLFSHILVECELPAGVVNVVYGTGSGVGSQMSNNPGIDLITFTGSTRAGSVGPSSPSAGRLRLARYRNQVPAFEQLLQPYQSRHPSIMSAPRVCTTARQTPVIEERQKKRLIRHHVRSLGRLGINVGFNSQRAEPRTPSCS